MEPSLLATNVRIPPLAAHLVHRSRLLTALECGIPRHKLTLVAAPAGYGKTTLLSQWAHTSPHAVAWVSLSAAENDPQRLFRYLLAAWATVQPDIVDSPLGVLLGGVAEDTDSILATFINVANEAPAPLAFVLDDYHLIHDDAIHTALTFLLDHLPPTLHVVLAGRGDPPLPLARYRARQELLELRAADLQFELPETVELLNRWEGLALADEALAALHQRLEGWAAGLHLVSLTLRRRATTDLPAISGQHRFIADYLGEEVLAHLPAEQRHFLLQTSILEYLSGPLCDAVVASVDSQAMLEHLERENLFLVPLDDQRSWFRYHRLFADVLRDELQRRHPEEVAPLHGRAARWHLALDLPEPAFDHALAAADVDLVMRICEDYTVLKLESGEPKVVARWLDAIPEAWYASHPELGLSRVAYLLFTGDFAAGARCLDDVEERLRRAQREDWQRQLAKVTMVRCAIACFANDLPRAETYADRALRTLAEEDLSYRADVYHALGDTYRRNARWEEAKASYRRALEIVHNPVYLLRSAHIFGALADLELRQGHLREAASYWGKALAAIQDRGNWGRLPLPVIGWVYLRMGEIFYERNDLAEAWEHLERGLERAELGGDTRALIAGSLLASRMKLTEGDLAAAEANLERAQRVMEDAPLPDWASRGERVQIELWLAQDRLRAALAWADAMLRNDALAEQPDREEARLALARVLIVKGDAPARQRAHALLDALLQQAEAEGRLGIEIEALALQALAWWQGGDRAAALPALERALRLAEPEGYVRLFADFGLPMARLLQEARARGVMPDYVARLLTACDAGLAPGTNGAALPEPLSPREQEVLALMAAGLTNREIADRLFIAAETVKKHSGSIYGKLGVGNRTEAAARARELGLLDEHRSSRVS